MAETIADQILYTTVKVATFVGNAPTGSGTAFFWRTRIDDKLETISLVTNRHVLDGADRVKVMCHLSDHPAPARPTGKFARLEVILSETIFHPDPDVDLVAIPFVSMLETARQQGYHVHYMPLEASNIPTPSEWSQFDSIEDVLMIGCPRGIFDEANNMPIARRGISATALSNRFEGRDEFLVDVACFPGSSGSPVFVYNQHGFMSRDDGRYHLGSQRFYFVGILYAGPTYTQEGEIVLSRAPSVEVAAMMHLGQVIRSSSMDALDARVRELCLNKKVPQHEF